MVNFGCFQATFETECFCGRAFGPKMCPPGQLIRSCTTQNAKNKFFNA